MCLSVITGSRCREGVVNAKSYVERGGARIFLDVFEIGAEVAVHIEQRALAAAPKAHGEQDRLILAVELLHIRDLLLDELIGGFRAELLDLALAAQDDVVGVRL